MTDATMTDWRGPTDEAYFLEQARRAAMIPETVAPVEPDWLREAPGITTTTVEAPAGRPHAPARPPAPARLAVVPPAPETSAEATTGAAAVLARLGARTLAEVSTEPPAPMLLGRLDPQGHTIIHGPGGVGKGVYTSHLVVRLAAAGHRVLILDYEGHPEEWARRIAGLGGADALSEVVHVAPMASTWKGRRGAIWRQAEDLRELATAWRTTFVVVDSIVVACGGADPMDPGTPAQYAGALEYLGLPVLSLAHVTKTHDAAYPFGSVFWHNLARVTWSLEQDGTGVLLVNRKANNYQRPGRVRLDVTWWNGAPAEVAERSVSVVLGDRIADVLASGPLSVAQIAARLDEERGEDELATKADSIRAVLRRGLVTDPPRFTVDGTGNNARWAVA